jgi:Arc/MetJ-type ribon-helix-helix transcriptional regulator
MSSAPAPRFRRARQAERLRKVSYQLRESVAQSVRAAVEAGAAPSANAFVEEAILRQLKELRRERLYAAYQEAANDPEYVAEMAELTAEFDFAVADGLRESEEGQ